MYPILDLGIFKIPSYSVLILLGGIAFTLLTIYIFEKKEKLSPDITNRILILSVFGFLILGGTAFVMNSLFHSIEKGTIALGGITWLGGVLWAFPSMILLIHRFCPQKKGEALEIFNLLIPGITLAHAFGRIGCFLGGCCYGRVTKGIWGIAFPAGSPAAKQYPAEGGGSLPVLPTQLYEALFELLLFIFMMVFYKKMKRHFFEIYAFSYGVFRFLLEFARGDDRGTTGFFLSPSQVMSFILILIGVSLLFYHKRLIFKRLHEKMDMYIKNRETPTNSDASPIIHTIRELKALADEGVITVEEFEAKKAELLKRI